MSYSLIAVLMLTVVAAAQDVTLQINEGLISGKYMTTKTDRQITGFIGIPYAEPPVGPLRFQPPVPKHSWSGIRESLDKVNICPQIDLFSNDTSIQGDEDCLYLNVYTPKVTNQSDCNVLPVMFFIHGGGYRFGHANFYQPGYLLDRNVVLVVINYRLGALGFFTTGDLVVPGNNGIKDQILAMKWVKNNIRTFGGDPNCITLFGESGGAASIHMHMMSPLSRGLFQSGISESGTALSLWNFAKRDEAVDVCKKLAETFGCPTNTSTDMINCLLQQNAYDFVQNSALLLIWVNDPPVIFRPVAEPEHAGAFLTQHPVHYIRSGNVAKVPWITGINADEGAVQTIPLLSSPPLLQQFNDNFMTLVPTTLAYENLVADVNATTTKIKEYYFKDGISTNAGENITNLFTDGWMLSTVDASIRLHLMYVKQPIYYYLFSYKGAHSVTQLSGDPNVNYVCHVDELLYLFPIADILFGTPSSATDIEMTDIFTGFWYNFTRLGRPTTKTSTVEWRKVTSNDAMEYLDIGGPNNLNLNNGLYLDRARFWRPIIDEILNSL